MEILDFALNTLVGALHLLGMFGLVIALIMLWNND